MSRHVDFTPPEDPGSSNPSYDAGPSAIYAGEIWPIEPEWVTAKTSHHIWKGHKDRSGDLKGGHRPGVNYPGKTTFPAGMTPRDIICATLAVRENPQYVVHRRVGTRLRGETQGFWLEVRVNQRHRVTTAFPLYGRDVWGTPYYGGKLVHIATLEEYRTFIDPDFKMDS